MPGDVTDLLAAWSRGDRQSGDKAMALLQRELRALASSFLRRERPGHTLQPTALVNEVYLKLVRQNRVSWKSRSTFLSVAAKMMRRILVDHARRRGRLKRGARAIKIQLDEVPDSGTGNAADILALNDALEALASFDPRKSALVELRFFGGFTIPETARFLGCSKATVDREWALAKAWLYRELAGEA